MSGEAAVHHHVGEQGNLLRNLLPQWADMKHTGNVPSKTYPEI